MSLGLAVAAHEHEQEQERQPVPAVRMAEAIRTAELDRMVVPVRGSLHCDDELAASSSLLAASLVHSLVLALVAQNLAHSLVFWLKAVPHAHCDALQAWLKSNNTSKCLYR